MIKHRPFTHNGWFFLCPVKVGEINSKSPIVAARWRLLQPWLTMNIYWQKTSIFLLSILDPNYEPRFITYISGRRRHA